MFFLKSDVLTIIFSSKDITVTPFIYSVSSVNCSTSRLRTRLANARKYVFSYYCDGLDKFLTLDNKNKFSLFSLNRNFALPLQSKKLLFSRKGQVPRLKTFHNLI